jgi:NAD(P)-dependent dehydrogenase (short-subunit alcohol dehydrogenase family)
MQDLENRVAVITGGASGIGLGMARAFAESGMKLMIADVDAEAVDRVTGELASSGAEVAGRRCDVSTLDEVEALADEAVDRFGTVSVFCANAGIGIPTATHKMKLDDWRWIIDVDLWGPIYGVHVFLPLLEQNEWGHINATSSMAGLIAGPMMGAYNVAKHGVVALMATLARDLEGRGSPVSASVLCPGPINTGISRNSVSLRPTGAKPAADGRTEGKAANQIQAILEQGMDPDDVGRLVLEGMLDERFWILTHPHWTKAIQKQLDAMDADGSLTRGR